MNCEQFDPLAADLASGRLVAGPALRHHLAECPRCRARLAAEQRLNAALEALAGELQQVSAPPAMEAALAARFAERHRGAAVRHHRPAVVGARPWLPRARLAALAAGVVLGLGLVCAAALRDAGPGTAAPMAVARPAPTPRVATPFYPLYATRSAAGTAEAGRGGAVRRVRMPRATLAVFGLPFNHHRAQDPITADLLLDPRGAVLAVRFVQ